MNEIAVGKENLKKALLDISKNYLDNIELAPAEKVHYSPKLERKMEKLLKQHRKPYRKLIDAPYKKAIAAGLAIFIFISAPMSCKSVREPVVEFFKNVYDKFTEFFFGEENKIIAPQVIEEIRMPTYIPEGYVLEENPVLTGSDLQIHTSWKLDNNLKIIFWQDLLTTKTTVDSEYAECKMLSNGIKIEIFRKETHTFAFWNDNEYSYTLIASDLPEEEILRIISSVD